MRDAVKVGFVTEVDVQRSVRTWLSVQTDPQHQALHHHPAFGQLMEPTLRPADYRAILGHIHTVFADVEAQRQRWSQWDTFALSPWLTALEKDIGPSILPAPGDWLQSPHACLGALYVLHGSAFGGRVIGARLAQYHPSEPRAYYSVQSDKAVWRELLAALERTQTPDAQKDLLDGAVQTFTRFGRFEIASQSTVAA